MITLKTSVGARPVEVRAFEPGDDETDHLDGFLDLVRRTPVLAVDTETTGLDPYAPGFAVRLVQVSDGATAYVLRADCHRNAIGLALGTAGHLVGHTAEFDLLALARGFDFLRVDELFAHTTDIATVSRLVDPLGAAKRTGGRMVPRHSLKALARKHLDSSLDFDKALAARLRDLKLPSKSNGGFAAIGINDPTYLLYAGLDAAITHQLAETFAPQTTGLDRLIDYEHRLAALLGSMRHRGLLVDAAYTHTVVDQLRAEWVELFRTVEAAGLSTTDLNTTWDRDRFAAVLTEHGVTLGATKTGKAALAEDQVVTAAAGTSAEGLVAAFYRCREVNKFARDYCKKFLAMADGDSRLHPAIHSLGAQTGRMSISDPPLQQIPRDGDARGCLIADPGHVLLAADYSQVEFRVAAALSGDENMIAAIRGGVDLHAVTATRLFGPDYTPEQRNIAKRAGFGRLYGGGPKALAQQCGVSHQIAEKAIAAFDSEYPRIVAFARDTGGRDQLTTHIGRRLPVDPDRSYAAINYVVQSEARDLFASAMLRLADAGFRDHLWLPVHDEIVINVPEADADDAARAMEQVMATDFAGIPITAEAHVLGKRWGK